MPSIWDLIAERETAAHTTAERLREQITTLSAELALAEAELADLTVTRATLTKLTGTTQTSAPDVTIASAAYQQILAVFGTATGGMRAKDVCTALGVGVTAKDTEGIRAKLKRLVARQILTETEPGLFTLAPTTPSP
jgi:hypothetical protein